MSDSEKELTIDELVEEINTFPPFDPEELSRRLEDPIARRMFCLDSSWKHHDRRNILPPSLTLVEAVLALADERIKEKNGILVIDVRSRTAFVNHLPVEKERDELTSAQEKLRSTLSSLTKYVQSGVVCKVSQEILDEIKDNLSKRFSLPPGEFFSPNVDSTRHPRGHFVRENPDGLACKMAEEILRGPRPNRH